MNSNLLQYFINEDYPDGSVEANSYVQRDLAVDGLAKLNNGISLIGHNIVDLAASLCWTNASEKSNFMSGSILTRMVLTTDNHFTIDTTGTYRVRFAPTFSNMMRLTISGDLTLGGTISSSTITAINTQITNLINGPQTFRGVSTRENGALYLDWNNVNGALDFDCRIQSTGGSSTQNGQGLLTFSNLRTV
jgi:hypothetical protein